MGYNGAMQTRAKLIHYAYLLRLDKPIGILLLLWPTLWALWLASEGPPPLNTLIIFIMGVVCMRSAGCAINDFADRDFDRHVERTRKRPLASGAIQPIEAIFLACLLALAAFQLVLFCKTITIQLAFIGLVLAILYPFMKRYTHLPQFILGAAFAFGVPMAFAEIQGNVTNKAWLVYAAALLWPIIYDTMYAMVDREDDRRVGIKSAAILFGRFDRDIIAFLQTLLLGMLLGIGFVFQLSIFYYCSLVFVACLFLYQQRLIHHRDPHNCFKAFMNNNWVGLAIFGGVAVDYLLRSS